MKLRMRIIWMAVGLAMVLSLAVGCASTQHAAAPAKTAAKAKPAWVFHDIVGVDFVKKYAKMPMSKDVMIIDARPKRAKYDKGAIPTAVSIPFKKFDQMVAKLPKDKNALLIFYCQGPT